VYCDGSENNPHPDFIVTQKVSRNKFYIEVKSLAKLFAKGGKEYLTVPVYQFDSYLRLSRWKSVDVRIIFVVNDTGKWYSANVETINRTRPPVSSTVYRDRRACYLIETNLCKEIKRK